MTRDNEYYGTVESELLALSAYYGKGKSVIQKATTTTGGGGGGRGSFGVGRGRRVGILILCTLGREIQRSRSVLFAVHELGECIELGQLRDWKMEMRGTMDLESPCLAESLAAHFTLEWLLLRVDESVISEVVLSPECLLTDFTRVRPLVRMSSFVNQQIVRLGEMSLAELADELLLGSIGSGVSSFGSRQHEPWSIVGVDE